MNKEKSCLELNLDIFLNNTILYKNEEFKAYFYENVESNKYKIIYDNKYYIYYLLNIPKEKEYIIKEKSEYEISIHDSTYDIFFYKNKDNSINCLLILIINDIDFFLTNENYLEFNEDNIYNLNNNKNIISKIKEKIIKYIQEEKSKNNNIENIEDILLKGNEYNLLYNKSILEKQNDDIINLTKIISKIETKKNISDYNNIFINVYEIFSPLYKSILAQKYLDEMPLNLTDLMIKYQEIYFSRNMFNLYKKNKSSNNKNNNNNITKIENKENNNINETKKIVFQLNKPKNIIQKKRFKIILKKIKRNHINKKIKKNIFKTHKNYNIDIKNKNQNDEKIIAQNNNICFKENKNNNIFKCITINLGKKNHFLVNKK